MLNVKLFPKERPKRFSSKAGINPQKLSTHYPAHWSKSFGGLLGFRISNDDGGGGRGGGNAVEFSKNV